MLSGEKADPQLIRKGSSWASVEGVIRFSSFDRLNAILEEEGLEAVPSSQSCAVRRELSAQGKSRAFFNDRQVSLSCLKRLLSEAIEIVDQDSAERLFSPSIRLELLDLWAHLAPKGFAERFAKETALEPPTLGDEKRSLEK